MKECGLPRGVYTQVKERGASASCGDIHIPAALIHKIERCCKIYSIHTQTHTRPNNIHTHGGVSVREGEIMQVNGVKRATFHNGIIPLTRRYKKVYLNGVLFVNTCRNYMNCNFLPLKFSVCTQMSQGKVEFYGIPFPIVKNRLLWLKKYLFINF